LGLGLDRVEARLRSWLVCGPGQCFKPHQDTEKHPGLVQALRNTLLHGGMPHRQLWLLLLLLDHAYAEHGLRWSLLKAEDHPRVDAL
jgi:hypothetical protein